MNLFPIWRMASQKPTCRVRRHAAPVVLALALLLAVSPAHADADTVIVAFGDSLTAGYQLAPHESFPAQLEKALRARGHAVSVVNAGVSGDTAASGLARLDWAVPPEVEAVIVELGANDALRGLNPEDTRAALSEIVARLKARGLPVLLAGMMAPRNMGPEFEEAFNGIYPEVAAEHDVLLYPFFLEGVATERALNLSDGMHPNASGVAAIVDGILPKVEKLLERVDAARNDSPRG